MAAAVNLSKSVAVFCNLSQSVTDFENCHKLPQTAIISQHLAQSRKISRRNCTSFSAAASVGDIPTRRRQFKKISENLGKNITTLYGGLTASGGTGRKRWLHPGPAVGVLAANAKALNAPRVSWRILEYWELSASNQESPQPARCLRYSGKDTGAGASILLTDFGVS